MSTESIIQVRNPLWKEVKERKPKHQAINRVLLTQSTITTGIQAPHLNIQTRSGVGRHVIRRVNSGYQAKPLPRCLVDTRKPNAIEIGTKTLELMNKQFVPSMKDTSSTIQTIAQHMKTQVNLNTKERAEVVSTLSSILDKITEFENIFPSTKLSEDFEDILKGLGSINYTQFGLKTQYIDAKTFSENRGAVMLCVLLNCDRLSLTRDRPIIGMSGNPILLSSTQTQLINSKGSVVIDLTDNTLKQISGKGYSEHEITSDEI